MLNSSVATATATKTPTDRTIAAESTATTRASGAGASTPSPNAQRNETQDSRAAVVAGAVDPCGAIKCSVKCEGECGWSRPLAVCATATDKLVTEETEKMERLGNCLDLDGGVDEEQGVVSLILIVVGIVVLVLICGVGTFVFVKHLSSNATTPGLSFATNVNNTAFDSPGASDGDLYASNESSPQGPSYAEIPDVAYAAFGAPGQATNVDDTGYQVPRAASALPVSDPGYDMPTLAQTTSALPVSDSGYEMPTLPASKPEPEYALAAAETAV